MLPSKVALLVFKAIHIRMKRKVSLAFSQLELLSAYPPCPVQNTLIGSTPGLPLGRYLLLHLALLCHTANLPFPTYICFVFIKFSL